MTRERPQPGGGGYVYVHTTCEMKSGCVHVDPPKGGGAPFRYPFRRLTPHRASIRRNHSGGNPIANWGLGNGTQKAWEMGSSSISHALRSPALGNGVPNFGQFPLQESASNPALPEAKIRAISKSQKCRSEGNALP